MKTISKFAAVITAAGLIAVAAASPSEARNGRNAAAIGGFAAGAVVGAAVANSANGGYYNNGYYGPGYGYYEPGYAYEPAYPSYDYGYAYEPAPTYNYGWRGRSGRSATGGQLAPNDYNTSAASVQ